MADLPVAVLKGINLSLDRLSASESSGRTFSAQDTLGDLVRIVRTEKLGMSQREFALTFGISLRTLQKWEQNERQPEGPARAYIAVLSIIPEEVADALRKAQDALVSPT